MGFPESGKSAILHNNIKDVAKFLNTKHNNNKYMVYNLVSERYGYDHDKFNNCVVRFPFDSLQPPKFNDLEPLCKAIDEWLSADNQVKIKRRLYKLNITLIE